MMTIARFGQMRAQTPPSRDNIEFSPKTLYNGIAL
jgi:hypothetical protein